VSKKARQQHTSREAISGISKPGKSETPALRVRYLAHKVNTPFKKRMAPIKKKAAVLFRPGRMEQRLFR